MSETRPERLSLNSKLLLFMVASFSIGSGAYMVLLNLYLKEIGFGEAFIGQILGLVSVGLIITTIPLAWLCGRIRIKGILIGSVVLNAVGDVLLILGPEPWINQIGAVISGMGMSAWLVATGPFIMRNATKSQRSKIFSWKSGLGMAGAAVASISFGRWVDALIAGGGDVMQSYQTVLVIATASKITAAVLGLFLTPHDPLPEEKRDFKDFVSARDWGHLFRLTFPTFLIGLGAGLTMPFMNLYFRNRFSMGPGEIGGLFFACQMFMALGTVLGPKFAERRGNIVTILLTQVTSLPFMLILAFTGNLYLAIAAFFIRSTLMNMGHPLFHHFAMEIVELREQAVTNASIGLAWNAAWFISSWLGGLSIEKYGFTPTIVATTAFYGVASMLQFHFFRKKTFLEIGRFSQAA